MKGDIPLMEAWLLVRLACFKSAGSWEKVEEACKTILFAWHVQPFKPHRASEYWFWCSLEGQQLTGAMYNILKPDLITPKAAAGLIGVASVIPYINSDRMQAYPIPAWINTTPARTIKRLDPEQGKRIRWLVRASDCVELKEAHERRIKVRELNRNQGLVFGRVEDLMREPGVKMPERYRPRRG